MKSNEKYAIKFYKKSNRKEYVTKGHPLYGGMMENSRISLKCPVDRNGRKIHVLDDDEIKEIATELGIPEEEFNFYSGKFWNKYRLELTKDDKILDLGNANDYIDYKVAINLWPIVAPNYEKRNKHPYIKYYVDKLANENKRLLGIAKVRKTVYEKYSKFEENKYVLKYVLEKLNHITSSETKIEIIQEMILDYIEKNVYKMESLFTEENLMVKGVILNAIESGVLGIDKRKRIKSRNTEIGAVTFKGEEPTFDNVARFLAEKKNSTLYATIKALINKDK